MSKFSKYIPRAASCHVFNLQIIFNVIAFSVTFSPHGHWGYVVRDPWSLSKIHRKGIRFTKEINFGFKCIYLKV